MPTELSLLRAVDIKGRAAEDDLAAALGADPAGLAALCRAQLDAGRLERAATGLRLSDTGRTLLADLLRAERVALDHTAVAGLYTRFQPLDREVKDIIRTWQVRDGAPDGQVPNDHTDADYDAAVLARLGALHERAAALLGEWAEHVPRLRGYPDRLAAALARAAGGDQRYVSGPTVDSYHTVWFELHEDLLGLAGRTRDEEAND